MTAIRLSMTLDQMKCSINSCMICITFAYWFLTFRILHNNRMVRCCDHCLQDLMNVLLWRHSWIFWFEHVVSHCPMFCFQYVFASISIFLSCFVHFSIEWHLCINTFEREMGSYSTIPIRYSKFGVFVNHKFWFVKILIWKIPLLTRSRVTGPLGSSKDILPINNLQTYETIEITLP